MFQKVYYSSLHFTKGEERLELERITGRPIAFYEQLMLHMSFFILAYGLYVPAPDTSDSVGAFITELAGTLYFTCGNFCCHF